MRGAGTTRWLAIAVAGAAALAGCENSPVELPEATTIAVSPASMSLYEGEITGVSAQVLDQDGRVMRNVEAEWSSSAPAVATVRDGLVQGVAPGCATLHATYGGQSATVEVTVEAETTEAASVEVMSEDVELHAQAPSQFVAYRVTDVRGRTNCWGETGATVTSSDESVLEAWLSSCGTIGVTPRFNGTATVTVTVDGESDSFDVTVVGDQHAAFWTGQPPAGALEAGETVQYTVRVIDQSNEGLEGETVRFSVDRGSLESTTAVTDADGFATVSWTLPTTLRHQPPGMSGYQVATTAAWDAGAIRYRVELASGIEQGTDYRQIEPGAPTEIAFYWMLNSIADIWKVADDTPITVEAPSTVLLHARAFDQYGNVLGYGDRAYAFEAEDPPAFSFSPISTLVIVHSTSPQTVSATAYAMGDDGLDPDTDLSETIQLIWQDPAAN